MKVFFKKSSLTIFFLFFLTSLTFADPSKYNKKIDIKWFEDQYEEIYKNVKLESSKPTKEIWISAYTKKFKPEKTRSSAEIYWEHIALRYADDVQTDINRNYSDTLVLTSNHGNFYGKKGLESSARILYSLLPDTAYTIVDTVVQGDWVTERWGYYNKKSNKMVIDGIDTFLILNGKIQVKMINYTVVPADISYEEYLKILGINN